MSVLEGQFVWFELATTDPSAAAAFYAAVVGWIATDSGMPDPAYTIVSAGTVMVGGMHALPPEARQAGALPGWRGYVGCADVDAMCPHVVAAGGVVRYGPVDIPGIGRSVTVSDPHGAPFMLFAPARPPPPGATPAPGTAGTVGWHELHAGDIDAAWAFYGGLFGWTKGEVIDAGPMGPYQLFSTNPDGAPMIGGMMGKSAQMPRASWLFYVNVPSVTAGVDRVRTAGGSVLNGPMQVPGGSWIAHCLDPQGVMFALSAQAD